MIHVSTESPRIAAVVESLGLMIDFLRPSALADDHTPLLPVLRYVTETFAARGRYFDEVWLLMACAPLIEPEDLVGAAQLYANAHGQWAVLSVTSYPVPLEWAFEREVNGRLLPVHPGKFAVRSQELGTKYYDTGASADSRPSACLRAWAPATILVSSATCCRATRRSTLTRRKTGGLRKSSPLGARHLGGH